MKRLTSMFLALSIVLSIFALPINKPRVSSDLRRSVPQLEHKTDKSDGNVQRDVRSIREYRLRQWRAASNVPQADIIEWTGTLAKAEEVDAGMYRLQIYLHNENEDMVQFVYMGEKFEGTFSMDNADFLMAPGFKPALMSHDGNTTIIEFTKVDLTVTAPDGPTGEVNVEATMEDAGGQKYHLVLADEVEEPQPIKPTEWTGTVIKAYDGGFEHSISIRLNDGTENVVRIDHKGDAFAGHYSTENSGDFDLLFSPVVLQSPDESKTLIYFKKVDLTITAPDGADNLETIEVEATLEDKEGNVYHLIASNKPIVKPTEWTGTVIKAYDGGFEHSISIRLNDGTENVVRIDHKGDAFAGHYSTENSGDFDLVFKPVVLQSPDESKTLIYFKKVDLTITAPDGADNLETIEVEATLEDKEGNVYHLIVSDEPIVGPDPDPEVTKWNGEIENISKMSGSWFIEIPIDAIGEEILAIEYYSEELTGEFSSANGEINLKETRLLDYMTYQTLISFTEVTIQVTAPEGRNGEVTVTGTLVDTDGKTYALNAKKQANPDPYKTIDIKATNLLVTDDILIFIPIMTLTGSNEEYEVIIEIAGENDGKYGLDELLVFVVKDDDEWTTNQKKPLEATLELKDNRTHLVGSILTDEAILYNIDLILDKPEKPEKTIEMVFTNEGELGKTSTAFQVVSSGYEIFPEINKDYSVKLGLGMYAGDPVGHHTTDYMMASYTTIMLCDPLTAQPLTTIVNTFYEVTLDVTMEGDFYVCKGEMWGRDNVLYKFTLKTALMPPGAIGGDEHKAPVSALFEEKPTLEYVEDGEYKVVYCDFDTDKDAAGLLFFVEDEDPDLVLPAGTYEINKSDEPGTVCASSGLTEKGDITYSFYGTKKETEEILFIDRLWYLTSGTVKVEHVNGELAIAVDAFNSWGVPVTLRYNLPLGVENTNAESIESVKFVGEDGNIYIRRNGQIYSVTGTLVQ